MSITTGTATCHKKKKKKKKKNGDTGNHQITSLQQEEWVTSVVFQGYLLPYTSTGTVLEISEISCPGLGIPIQAHCSH